MDRYEVRLSGAGGQGMVLAGLILAEAACIYDGKYAVQTRSYGPEARGGASKSEVVIDSKEIDYPKVINPDLFLAMTQEAYDKYYKDIKKDGITIIDSFHVTKVKKKDIISIPITPTARTELGNELFANTLSLGIIVALTNVVSRDALEKAVLARSPKGTEEINKKAIRIGFETVQRYKAGEEIRY